VYTGPLTTPVLTAAQLNALRPATARRILDELYEDMRDLIRTNERQIRDAEKYQAYFADVGDTVRAADAAKSIPRYRAEIAQARANQDVIVAALNRLGPGNA
jgi:HPt (histidine-containing phosphotransfer) domain-containing protein